MATMDNRRDSVARREIANLLALGGVIGPVLSVLTFTVVGALRPDYSPVRTAISALGTGPDGWPIDTVGVLLGVALIAFSGAFVVLMRPVIRRGARWFATSCFALDGLGVGTASVFTSSPTTVLMHTVGSTVATVSTIVAFGVVGVALRRNERWRRMGNYSLVAMIGSVALVGIEYAFLIPRSPLHPLQVGGLLERLDVCWHYAWYVVFGWRLFRNDRRPHRSREFSSSYQNASGA